MSSASSVVAVLAGVLSAGGCRPAAETDSHPSGQPTMSQASSATTLRGKTVRWTFTEGPVAGSSFEHDFDEDGTVVWRVTAGPMAGASARETDYAAVRISDTVHAVSYRGASGHTLTVVLNLENHQMVGFASNDTEWYAMHGTFEIVD
jgi:phenolic acid decarboxylase